MINGNNVNVFHFWGAYKNQYYSNRCPSIGIFFSIVVVVVVLVMSIIIIALISDSFAYARSRSTIQ